MEDVNMRETMIAREKFNILSAIRVTKERIREKNFPILQELSSTFDLEITIATIRIRSRL